MCCWFQNWIDCILHRPFVLGYFLACYCFTKIYFYILFQVRQGCQMIPNIFKERSAFEMLKSEFQIDTTWHRRRPEFLFERI